MGNAYMAKSKLDPGKEQRRGSLSALVQNMNMRSPHAGDPHVAGVNRRDYAERYNSGALPWQIEMQQLEEKQLEGESLRDYRKQSINSTDLNDYTKLFASGKIPKRQDGSSMPYNEWVRSMGNSKGGQPKSVQELEYIIKAHEQSLGRSMSGGERGKFIADNWFPNKRGAMQTDIQGAPVYTQQSMGGGFEGTVAENTLPGEGEGDPVTGAIPDPSKTIAQAAESERQAAGKKEATVIESRKQQEADSVFRDNASELVQEMRQQLGNTLGLMEAIESGDFNETGPFEQYFKTWGNKESAELAADAMMQALLNLQITKLTPVTENEMAEIKKLYADVGKDPQANIGALSSAVRRLMEKMRMLQKKRDYWNANDNTLKGYGLKTKIGEDEDWMTPLPSTYQMDVPGIVEVTEGGRKQKSAADYLEGAK